MDEDYVEAVLDVVAQIPRGKVMTYGDVAGVVRSFLGRGGPRNVGLVVARHGGDVPWWRVVNASGVVCPKSHVQAIARLREEECPLSGDGQKVRLSLARLA